MDYKNNLYRPDFEHDSCGIGFLANIKGLKSHKVVKDALAMLKTLEHRAGQGLEDGTGDGAGILLQIPHEFFVEELEKLGVKEKLKYGYYGVGMLFLPQNKELQQQLEQKISDVVKQNNQTIIAWRNVPVNPDVLGKAAFVAMPCIKQIFIQNNNLDIKEFERTLYTIRKQIEKIAMQLTDQIFYFASLSSTTIVYKGMMTTDQVEGFYLDLLRPNFKTALALVHSRFSTNTFPSWERAHPHRYIIHNGEINTIRGNSNWMHARESGLKSDLFKNIENLTPIINKSGSDSTMFDNVFEFLTLCGRDLAHVAMMMIPEPWQNENHISKEKHDFYKYHSTIMEPWDGPTAIAATNGKQIVTCLDRNGLRPMRYYITRDDYIILSSEVGVLETKPEDIILKERLRPGQLLLIDLEEGRIIPDSEIKKKIATQNPYDKWSEQIVNINDINKFTKDEPKEVEDLRKLHLAFGYTYEELTKGITSIITTGEDPVGSMGYDAPLAVLSKKPQLLSHYFKQLFAQVTNPPIDAIREASVTALGTTIGKEGNLLNPTENKHIFLPTPILTNKEFEDLQNNHLDGFKTKTIDILFDIKNNDPEVALREALENVFKQVDKAIADNTTIIILTDKNLDYDKVPIPALLAVSGLHHYLIRQKTRTKVGIVLQSGEPREVHHFCTLIGYGACAVNPYLVYDSINNLIEEKFLTKIEYKVAVKTYVKAVSKGMMKVLSKMGISTMQSYRGAQVFEAVGIDESVIDEFFTWTTSRIGGIKLKEIAEEAILRHQRGYPIRELLDNTLDSGDDFQYRMSGDPHLYNPQTIHLLQQACRTGNYDMYKTYSELIESEDASQAGDLITLRSMLKFSPKKKSIPLEEVEPVEEIVKRFRTGAMSYGSISKEAHETLAIAMNRIGGRSNSGEGGETEDRFTPDENGDLRRSAIKQVASGRFGVTSHYLVNSDEIQIKIAQGAKPGEGGQLPGYKVYPWVAEARYSTPGVSLISPPPHHDIYSIEDLSQLIYDLKNANKDARISVKLVAGTGVGTIAAGVAKGRADHIIISGYDGGTGAASKTSIKHAGLPWELGLAEAHQTLVMNNLRDKVSLETDGKIMTGRSVVIAAMLGAEEFAFSTAPLVAIGCTLMRVCHMDTCPVGIATQNPELRKNFTGDPSHVVNFMTFIAKEIREIMADLGFKSFNEMIGRTDYLEQSKDIDNWKAKHLDLSRLLYDKTNIYKIKDQDKGIDQSLDMTKILDNVKQAIEGSQPVEFSLTIKNTDRAVGTIVGSYVTRKHGKEGLPSDTIKLNFVGSAGQSFGAFVPHGMTLSLEGDANDYVGKGLSGGKIIVSNSSNLKAPDNIIIGNTSFYGATRGKAYINGQAGERFCVRNSGAKVVVEGMGDHGLEYMTGGRVINLGTVGKNFGAGMSGGIAYMYEPNNFEANCNIEMILLEIPDESDLGYIKSEITKHMNYTNSRIATKIIDNWEQEKRKFIKVIPKDYKKAQGL